MEFVYVVPRAEVFPDCYPHGFRRFGEELGEDAFLDRAAEAGFFVERDYAERTPALKQIIPYAIVVTRGKVLLLKRTKRGGEARLHDKLSIGVGGHVNPIDAEPKRSGAACPSRVYADADREDLPSRNRNAFYAATRRELAEELHLESTSDPAPLGILNDDSNPVGAVHVGMVQLLAVEGTVEVRETEQLEGSLVTPHELREMLADGANFESWSRLLIPHLDQLIPKAPSSRAAQLA